MLHEIKKDYVTLQVESKGAELHGLYTRNGPEAGWLWDGGTAWPRRAPVCFPWCGRLKDTRFEENGRLFDGLPHGIVRDLEHRLVEEGPDYLAFQVCEDGNTLSRWPWRFRFDTVHRLEGNAVITTCTVCNTGDKPMPVQLGFHTGLRCPFSTDRTPEDYFLRFEQEESPYEVCCNEDGMLTGEETPIFTGQRDIPLHLRMFDHDSICLKGLKSAWIELTERGTGRSVRMDISGYPYVLLWSKPDIPGFLCIEPWHGLPSRQDGGHTLWERPNTLSLAPGGTFSATQRLTITE